MEEKTKAVAKPKKKATQELVQTDNFKKQVDTELANRAYFRDRIEETLKEKADYHIIKGKKSLAKGGAEKLASMFQLVASFEIDKEMSDLLGEVKAICLKCILKDKDENFRGEGRGASSLAEIKGDPNKAIKMAEKRAYIDAVIRTTGLSDIFTQDLEDMPQDTSMTKVYPKPHTAQSYAPEPQQETTQTQGINPKQLETIGKLLEELGAKQRTIELQVGRPLMDLTFTEASNVINQLINLKNKSVAPKVQDAEVEKTGLEDRPIAF